MHTAVNLGESYVCFRFEPKQTKALIYRKSCRLAKFVDKDVQTCEETSDWQPFVCYSVILILNKHKKCLNVNLFLSTAPIKPFLSKRSVVTLPV